MNGKFLIGAILILSLQACQKEVGQSESQEAKSAHYGYDSKRLDNIEAGAKRSHRDMLKRIEQKQSGKKHCRLKFHQTA